MGPGRDDGATPERAPHGLGPQDRQRGSLPEVLSSLMVYSGAVVSLRVDEVRAATGSVTREVVEHAGAVVMVAPTTRSGGVGAAVPSRREHGSA